MAEVHSILLIYPLDIPHARVARYTLARLTVMPNPFEIFVAATDHIIKHVHLESGNILPIRVSPRNGEVVAESVSAWTGHSFDALVCLAPEPGDDLLALMRRIKSAVTIGFSDGEGDYRFTVELVKRQTEFLENSYGSVLGLFGLKSVR
ncbi:MAG: hypothetical protein K9N34_03065 [Candidatus Marinimicrobia bacterium]|nr:hypothetical protein [Candidatus Neomarinimicrobiota bacterium]MCF7839502.1 hypothetical protein [Candidatus Neomarinimicrobiota bacterium]MCF7902034.1 hypothetical protein [Candidatus Neomarinimicrobiota bacterium]